MPFNKRNHWTLIIISGIKKVFIEALEFYKKQDSIREHEIQIKKQ